MDYSKLAVALNKLVKVWAESYYTKPFIESVSLFCIYSICRSKKNHNFRTTALTFCIGVASLFLLIDLSLVFYRYNIERFEFYDFVKYQEFLNGLFSFVEWFTIYKIVNFGIDNRRLRSSGRLLLLILVVKEILLRTILHNSTNLDTIQTLDEFSSGISFALFTLYFTLYYVELYKMNIMSTFLAPSAYVMFCYVVLSLLFFPTAYYLFMCHYTLGYAFYAYHDILGALACLIFRYNILNHESKPINYLTFYY